MAESLASAIEKSTGYLARFKRPALGLVFLVLTLVILTYLLDIDAVVEPPYLAFTLNFLCISVSSFIIAIIAARSFIKTGSWSVIWLGAGALTYGLTMLVAGWMLGAGMTGDAAVTTHNIGALLASGLHFLGAFFTLNRIPPREAGPGKTAFVLWLYGVMIVLVVYLMVASAGGLFPPFFIQGTGGTTFRNMVVATAGLLFLAAGLIFLRQYRLSKSDLLYWYSLGLIMLSIGMMAILLQTSMGTALNWTGRGAQLFSGLFLLAAALVTLRQSRAKRISSGEAIVTLLSQTEARLRETQERFRMVFERAKLGIVITDMDQIIFENNPALEHMLGFTGEELRHRKFTELIHPEDAGAERPLVEELISGAKDYYQTENRLVRQDGRSIWVRLTGSLIRGEDGAPLFNMVLVDDISERKEIEKLKDDFIGMVSHELKNPLTVVMGSLQMVKKGGLAAEDLHDLITNAAEATESLAVILDNMLELSRAQAGRLKLLPEKANLTQLIAEVVEVARHKTVIHRLLTDIPEGLPPVVIDPVRIQLVLRNFLDNAIKYSPRGGNIIVFVRQEQQETIIGVKDEGIGISKTRLQDLFHPFERLGMDVIKGTGLGLIVCRRLIEAHKGRLWVESEPDKGSVFYFSLPAAPRGPVN